MKFYLAGPMRGHYRYNMFYFDDVAACLRRLGATVVSPVDMDRKEGMGPEQWDEEQCWDIPPPNMDPAATMIRDLCAIAECDAVVLLDGYERSRGVACERAFAAFLNKPCLTETQAWAELSKELLRETADPRS